MQPGLAHSPSKAEFIPKGCILIQEWTLSRGIQAVREGWEPYAISVLQEDCTGNLLWLHVKGEDEVLGLLCCDTWGTTKSMLEKVQGVGHLSQQAPGQPQFSAGNLRTRSIQKFILLLPAPWCPKTIF